MLQLIYELRKNWCGRVDGTGGRTSKVLQEILADLKIETPGKQIRDHQSQQSQQISSMLLQCIESSVLASTLHPLAYSVSSNVFKMAKDSKLKKRRVALWPCGRLTGAPSWCRAPDFSLRLRAPTSITYSCKSGQCR